MSAQARNYVYKKCIQVVKKKIRQSNVYVYLFFFQCHEKEQTLSTVLRISPHYMFFMKYLNCTK